MKPFFKQNPRKQNQSPFLNSRYTIDEYKREISAEWTAADHLKRLSQCIAIMTTGYAVKRQEGFKIIYERIGRDKLEKDYLSDQIEIGTGTFNKHGDEIVKTITPMHYVRNVKYRDNYEKYNDIQMFSDDEHVLTQYVPPYYPEIDTKYAKRVLDFFEDRIENTRAFKEYISSHAHRLRYQTSTPQKVFAFYSKAGHTGKSVFAYILSLLYPKLANINIHHDQITEKANGFIYDLAYAHVEEVEGHEQVSKHFPTFIKMFTNTDASIRKMYQDTYAGKNYCILSFSTNRDDLDGLINQDMPTLERLVILHFKEKPLTPKQWNDAKIKLGIDSTLPDFKKNIAKLAASMYHYLMHEYTIVDGYSDDRYYEEEKWKLIEKLRAKTLTPPDEFVRMLDFKSGDTIAKGNDSGSLPNEKRYYILEKFKLKKPADSPPQIRVACNELNYAWKAFSKVRLPDNTTYTVKSAQKALTRIGFEYKHTRNGDFFIIVSEKFDAWLKTLSNDEEDDMSDENIVLL